MSSLPESPEPQWLGIRGVELCPMPDGCHSVRLATVEGLMQARLREVPGARAAVVLAGPAAYQPSLARIDEELAADGLSSLTLAEGPLATDQQVRAARGFLAMRGVRRMAVLAAAHAAPRVLAEASGWSLVALLAPSLGPDPARLAPLCASPLLLVCGDDAEAAHALARAAGPGVELLDLGDARPRPGAQGATLASEIVPRLVRALREVPAP